MKNILKELALCSLWRKIYLEDFTHEDDLKADVVAARLFAILLTCGGAILIYYTINTGEALDKIYPFFLFTGIVITLLGVIGLFFRLRE